MTEFLATETLNVMKFLEREEVCVDRGVSISDGPRGLSFNVANVKGFLEGMGR